VERADLAAGDALHRLALVAQGAPVGRPRTTFAAVIVRLRGGRCRRSADRRATSPKDPSARAVGAA
jgi:hypothetical protein